MTKPEFDFKVWQKIRSRVIEIGQFFINADNQKIDVSMEKRINLMCEQDSLIRKSNAYLDSCGMKMPKPTWEYKRDDETTHKSHEYFAYSHLVI